MVDCGVVLSQTVLSQTALSLQLDRSDVGVSRETNNKGKLLLVHSYVLLVSLVEGTMVVRLDGCVDSFSMVVLVI